MIYYKIMRKIRCAWGIVFCFLLIVFLLKTYIIQPFFTLGMSMEPTIKDREIVFVNKIIYKFKMPERGDIIVFRTNESPPLYFTKRIIGLPGETIEIKKGRIFINGRYYPEPYTEPNPSWNLEGIKIKDNCVYVIGDNRRADIFSHLHTQVAVRNITGKVMGKR